MALLAGCFKRTFCNIASDENQRRGVSKTRLRFQIAVHNPVVAHQAQRHDHLACESSNQRGGEADETIGLDQFIQINTEQLHRDTEMIPEIKVLSHFDDMVLLFLVLRKAVQVGARVPGPRYIPICEGYPKS